MESAAVSNSGPAEPRFQVSEAPGQTFSRSEMLESNPDDGELAGWLRTAGPGESRVFGGGAAGEVTVTRRPEFQAGDKKTDEVLELAIRALGGSQDARAIVQMVYQLGRTDGAINQCDALLSQADPARVPA